MNAVLELCKVTKLFGRRCILKDVQCSIAAGTVSLLTGANGAGKSTLLRIMAGLAKPSMGQVHCHVEEKHLGYLGHATFVYPALTAQENLLFWANMYGLRSEEKSETAIKNVLERVELASFAGERAGVFSRGMAQRLNLARLLLLGPKLWLLDEPSTGLDVRSASILADEVHKAKHSGAAIVWISHDVEAHAPLADAVLRIEKARLESVPSALSQHENVETLEGINCTTRAGNDV